MFLHMYLLGYAWYCCMSSSYVLRYTYSSLSFSNNYFYYCHSYIFHLFFFCFSILFFVFLSLFFVVSTFPYMVPVTDCNLHHFCGTWLRVYVAGTISWVNHMTVNESISLCQRSSVLRDIESTKSFMLKDYGHVSACQCYPY